MKIGIISDVHGDFDALCNALDRLESVHQVDEILCAGDLIGRGPNPNRVVDLIRERGIVTVRGNHDEWAYDISAENRSYLKNLPVDWQGNYNGFSVYMCHGKPGNNIWGLYKAHVSDTLLNMMLASLGADVLITGHTHVPMFARVDQGCVVNPGSLYTMNTQRVSSHTYGVLRLPKMNFTLYDILDEKLEPVKIRG